MWSSGQILPMTTNCCRELAQAHMEKYTKPNISGHLFQNDAEKSFVRNNHKKSIWQENITNQIQGIHKVNSQSSVSLLNSSAPVVF